MSSKPAARRAPATVAIAAATAAASLFILLRNEVAYAAVAGGIVPARFFGAGMPPDIGAVPAWATPLTATLVHGGLAHLLFNLVVLVYSGVLVERALGSRAALLLYVVGAYAAAAGQVMTGGDPTVPTIGASGAASAWVAAYAMLYGRGRARAIGPMPAHAVHALWLAVAWVGIQALTAVAGLGGDAQVAVDAHLGGFVPGLLLARPMLRWRWREA